MGIINLLDIQVANLIAAGEVVDRPASAIKELAENSIDAGATSLTIEIKRGGVKLMRVADNGCGMTRDDAIISIKRHATSKIKNAADLDGIISLGFRGEALAAISSVSHMRVMTRHKSERTGSIIDIENGVVNDVCDFAGSVGTTIIVEELFLAVPARRKFLKKDSSEAMAVSAVVEKIALSRPDIAIKYILDGEIKLQTAGDGKLLSVIYAIFGKSIANRMIHINSLTEGIEITGFIGAPDIVRSNRNFQNFFINGRYVKSYTAAAALEQAFHSYCEVNRFPVCVLNIILHPAFVDVNVHPTKLEVKFSNERAVFNAVYCAVRNTLTEIIRRPTLINSEKAVQIVETFQVKDEQRAPYNDFVQSYDNINDENAINALVGSHSAVHGSTVSDGGESKIPVVSQVPVYDRVVEPNREDRQQKIDIGQRAFFELLNNIQENLSIDQTVENKNSHPNLGGSANIVESSKIERREVLSDYNLQAQERTSPLSLGVSNNSAITSVSNSYRYIGLAFNTYIIVESDGVILMIDKHAAHERIIFENMRKNRSKSLDISQILINPIVCKMSSTECSILDEYRDEILAIGFDYSSENSKSGEVLINSIPCELNAGQAVAMIEEIVGGLLSGTGDPVLTKAQRYEQVLYQASCKAALKAGTDDNPAHLRYICERIFAPNCDDVPIAYCPHGRPVVFEMSRVAIENKFRRT